MPELAAELIEHTELDADAVETCADDYVTALEALDREVADLVDDVPPARRLLLTNHDSLGYFADRYGFEVVGTVIPAPSGLAATSPAQLEELAEVISETGVTAIFAETQHSTDDAEALADRVGDVEVVTLLTGTLGEPDSDAGSYTGFLRSNAILVTEALR